MTQNFDTDQLQELAQDNESDTLDDDYWYEKYLSDKEEEAIEKRYLKDER